MHAAGLAAGPACTPDSALRARRDYSAACKANLEAIAANRVSTTVTNAGPARQLHRKLLSMQGKLPEGGSRFWDY